MEKKIWGSKIRLLETPTVVVDLLALDKNSFCSWHYHEFKYNMFFVLEGIVEINLQHKSKTIDRYKYYIVEPKIKHQFITKGKATMLEIMYTKSVLEQDIIREIQGGKIINGKHITEDKLNKKDIYQLPEMDYNDHNEERDFGRGFNGMREKDYE